MGWKMYVVLFLSCALWEHQTLGLVRSYIGNNLTDVPERYFYNKTDLSKSITKIDLTDNKLTTLPDFAFRQYIQLDHLKFQRNNLSIVSPLAFSGTSISTLDLSWNLLPCIPDLTAIHKTLTLLAMYSGVLYRCSTGISYQVKFSRLHKIYLAANYLTRLDAMTILWAAPHLQHVYLNYNQLKQVPNFQPLLPDLQTFMLIGNPITCSCQIKWLTVLPNSGLSMKCKEFGPLSGKSWNSLPSLVLDKYCESLNTMASLSILEFSK